MYSDSLPCNDTTGSGLDTDPWATSFSAITSLSKTSPPVSFLPKAPSPAPPAPVPPPPPWLNEE